MFATVAVCCRCKSAISSDIFSKHACCILASFSWHFTRHRTSLKPTTGTGIRRSGSGLSSCACCQIWLSKPEKKKFLIKLTQFFYEDLPAGGVSRYSLICSAENSTSGYTVSTCRFVSCCFVIGWTKNAVSSWAIKKTFIQSLVLFVTYQGFYEQIHLQLFLAHWLKQQFLCPTLVECFRHLLPKLACFRECWSG